ncbi:hypothetical protein BDFB_009464, partial [Asbolus verrucosus]
QDCSPLLRPSSPNKPFEKNGQLSVQNRNNAVKGQLHFKNSLYNRLGNRNFQHRNNNLPDNAPVNSSPSGQRNFNRKRISDTSTGPLLPKRKWSNNKSFYANSNNQQNHNLAQSRLNRIRTTNMHGSDDQIETNSNSYGASENNTQYLNDSQELDPTDITVEVVNNSASAPQEDESLTRFKMILDPKAQTAIRLLQQKRKDKQVIFPFPVTPNVTGVSLHERFSLL